MVPNSKPLQSYQRRIRRLQRQGARRQQGSKRHARTKRQLARCHHRVGAQRADALHQLTSRLVTTYGTLVIEDLAVKNMTAAPRPKPDPARPGAFARNGRRAKAALNRAILDTAPGEFRRQLSYKLSWHGGTLVVAEGFYPSSRICSSCANAKTKLSRATRTYHCEHCGLVIDRDLNAAQNLAAFGQRSVAGGRPETKNARGGDSSRHQPRFPVKREGGSGRPHQTVLGGKSAKLTHYPMMRWRSLAA